jgi:hypothetical protein
VSNTFILLPGSLFFPDVATAEAFMAAPYERDQHTIETEFGWVDVYRATKRKGGWSIMGYYTPRLPDHGATAI